jgi:hypothetical protein
MTEERALLLAQNYARSSGYDINQYEAKVHPEEGGKYAVMFDGVVKAPGSFFTVYVDAQSRECSVIPGR